ncbi:endonuclease domain-containing protein [Sphingorhabdus soli]|uniref:Endonuclease domain-containing protein n=1 Tax=Flavisphingopyxis soli TaxID=2601267 RepID=A0A5C6UK90_9SPHN|nr:DUF559 domain-containing protein [Sphingorhabdus soli]TXC73237.1 endonuclease domain-containing protein [Sphingorhabdus soli]
MKRDRLPSNAIPRARKLRRTATEAETILWRVLREKLPRAKFRRQVPLGRYFADFASHGAKLVIEVDGGQHGEAAGYDAARTLYLEHEGYRVLRFSNHDVIDNLDGVLEALGRALTPHPSATSEQARKSAYPSPTGGEGQ